MKLKTVIFALGAFLAVATASRAALAGYVCGTSYRPGSSSLGSEGYAWFTVYESPDCAGATWGIYYLCTAGATSTSCASSAVYRYDRQSLIAAHRTLVDALTNNLYISNLSTTCIGGGSGCGSYVQLYAD